MIEGSISRRYSKALFQLAQEQKQEEAIGQEIDQFLNAYMNSPLHTVLTNPAFSLENRKKILTSVTKSLQLSPLSIHFISLLLERDRLPYLSFIAEHYRRLLNETKNRVEATVVAASPLDATMLERLRQTLHTISGKEVVLHEKSDPALLGGLLVELEGKIYDGSVRTQLETMKQRITREY
ncbi:MAG TPA: ATP synthase F1 subunit delta [Candidatus Acidoferrales bacterium]|nr:ATP synthase F1 subunit delta [Candidatus Acidoferrales bacterium]